MDLIYLQYIFVCYMYRVCFLLSCISSMSNNNFSKARQFGSWQCISLNKNDTDDNLRVTESDFEHKILLGLAPTVQIYTLYIF